MGPSRGDRGSSNPPAGGADRRARASARADREADRARESELLERVRVELGITQAECARWVGMPKQHYANLEDPDHQRNLGSADQKRLPIAMQHALIREWASELGLLVCEAPEADDVTDLHEHLSATIREAGEASSTYARAVADGKIDVSEAAVLVVEAREAKECFAALENSALDVLSSGPIPIDRRGSR